MFPSLPGTACRAFVLCTRASRNHQCSRGVHFTVDSSILPDTEVVLQADLMQDMVQAAALVLVVGAFA